MTATNETADAIGEGATNAPATVLAAAGRIRSAVVVRRRGRVGSLTARFEIIARTPVNSRTVTGSDGSSSARSAATTATPTIIDVTAIAARRRRVRPGS